MPLIEAHVKASLQRTGKEYREVHEWVDQGTFKVERHDITRLPEHAAIVLAKWGEEGVQEYVQHLRDDLEAKFQHIVDDLKQDMMETLAYFGVKPAVPR